MPNLSKAYLGAIPLFNQIETKTNYYDPTVWTRPTGWLNVPSIIGQQKFIGLHKVENSTQNHVALRMSGDFCVEWGDGTSGTYLAGSTAFKNLDYNSYSNDGEQLFGYRQALVSAYPISGSNLNFLDLSIHHPDFEFASRQYNTKWLDIYLNAPSLRTGDFLTISTNAANTPRHRNLEQATLLNIGNTTSLNNEFLGCDNLKSVSLGSTSKVVSGVSMFQGCSSLVNAPIFSTIGLTAAAAMFNSCSSLKNVPAYDFSLAASSTGIFFGCSDLESVSGIKFGNNVASSFQNCFNLTKLNCSVNNTFNLATIANNMFANTNNLSDVTYAEPVRIPILNYSGCKFDASGLNKLFQNLDFNMPVFVSGVSGSSFISGLGLSAGPFNVAGSPLFFRNISGGDPLNESTIYLLKTFSISGCTITTGVSTNPAIVLNSALTGAELRYQRHIRVSQNYGTSQPGYDPSIATGKLWAVLN